MSGRRTVAWALTAGRAVNTIFFLFTSVFCLLTYSPFAYEQFIQPHVIAWLSNFVLLYADFYWLALCVTALTLVPYLRTRRLRAGAWTYLGVAALVGIVVTLRPVLPGGGSPARSLTMAFTSLVPLFWLAALDRSPANPFVQHADLRPPAAPSRPSLHAACLWTAAFVWATYAILAVARLRAAGGLIDSGGALAVGIAMSAVAHLTAFALLFLAMTAIALVTGRLQRPESSASGARIVLASVAAALVLQRVVFTPISIGGLASWMLACALGFAMVLAIAGMARFHAAARRSKAAAALTLLVLPFAAFAALAVVTTFDWGFMLQKLSALAVAAIAFRAFATLAGTRDATGAGRGRVALPIAAMVVFATSTVAAPRLSAWTHDPRLDAAFALDAYSAGDPSFRLLRQFLDRNQTLQRDADFYAYLRANSSIEEPVRPVSVDFVETFDGTPSRRPDVFLFLVDSLRRDYVSPYNPAVTFTPAFEAFAHESFVFERAFTRYGGTGLAVPSVWAGAMLLHKQYVTPFAPTNALAKLIDGDGYRRAVTFDHITDELFGFPDGGTTLDRSSPEMTHTLCRTVDEIEADLQAHAGDSRPVFAHTRSLDLHIGNTRLAAVPPGESYPGFFGPYAARVRRIDACFGEFVGFLKRTNRYDHSIVVVMSDHGDSLGEGLRWGHGYTVFPEVIRIPLMIHVPSAIREAVTADLARVSFATDVTPTLYALLGHDPKRPRAAAGSPLFARAASPLVDRSRDSFLVASSYGAVYGLVRQNGRRLYVADAIEGRDYLFDLGRPDGDVRIGITDAERLASRATIREQVGDLAAWYGLRR